MPKTITQDELGAIIHNATGATNMTTAAQTSWTWTTDEWARIMVAANEARNTSGDRIVAIRAARSLRHYAKVATVLRRPTLLQVARIS